MKVFSKVLLVAVAAALIFMTATALAGSRTGGVFGLWPASHPQLMRSSASRSAEECPSLRKVKAFQGHATLFLGVFASGSDPDSGGTETIGLSHLASKVDISLTQKIAGRVKGVPVVEFIGHAHGGEVKIADAFKNTGTDLAGQMTYDGPIHTNNAFASVFFRRGASCEFKFHLGFGLHAMFQGDADVDPGPFVGGAATTEAVDIPQHLRLNGEDYPGIYPECKHPLETSKSCALVYNGWLGDAIALAECGSLNVSHCQLKDDFEIGKATFSWHLKPVFKHN